MIYNLYDFAHIFSIYLNIYIYIPRTPEGLLRDSSFYNWMKPVTLGDLGNKNEHLISLPHVKDTMCDLRKTA